jgi:hypothetical protein
MKDETTDTPDGIAIIEDDGETIIIEVSEENYQRDLAAGLDEDEILKPGRHKFIRGGFLKRHPELKPRKKSA